MQKTSVRILSAFLADTFFLYFKTHVFHWNVRGPLFVELHTLFEKQYTELYLNYDDTAERIRTYNVPAPGTTTQLKKLTCIQEHDEEQNEIPNARDMIKFLYEDHERIIQNLNSWIEETAEDISTQDYLIDRVQYHKKTAWMLRSLIEG